MNEEEISFYNNKLNTKPKQNVKIESVLNEIKSGVYKKKIEHLRTLSRIKDGDSDSPYTLFKLKLPSVTFAGIFTRHKKDCLQKPSGYMILDADHVQDLASMKEKICNDQHVSFCFVSPGGDGLKIGIKVDPAKWTATYLTAEKYFLEKYNLKLDPANKDVSRLCFMSYDPELFVNHDSEIFQADPEEINKELPKESTKIKSKEPPCHEDEKTKAVSLKSRLEKYCHAALNDACLKISQTPKGGRNNTTNKESFGVGQLIGTKALTRSEVEAALIQSGISCGLSQSEAETAVKSGLDAGEKEPRDLSEIVKTAQNKTSGTGKRIIFSVNQPFKNAQLFVKELFSSDLNRKTLRHYASMFMNWRDNRYSEISLDTIKNKVYDFLDKSVVDKTNRNGEVVVNKDTGEKEVDPFSPNKGKVENVLDALKADVHLTPDAENPSWLYRTECTFPANEVIACKTKLLHLPTLQTFPATPAFFSTSALDFDYDKNAPEPKLWFSFLKDIWGEDTESIEALQEWFGYFLSGETKQQKMLLLVGPKRSGKGTIARILRGIIGAKNICSPTTFSLRGQFGLQPLLNKSLAIVSDARFKGKSEDLAMIIERLLNISGEDAITVDRKWLESVTLKLPTRMMFLWLQYQLLRTHKPCLRLQQRVPV
ncbi:MAG: hypothetical protein HQM08_30945 [Candidatus Riflebacteria bacterium]|nr:hypothetical protein [Candidatus Riflebacteria bacterium]